MGTPDPLFSPTARIRHLLDERGLSFQDLADLSGVHYKRVLRVVKHDLSEPRMAETIAFAAALGVTVASLYEPMEEVAA